MTDETRLTPEERMLLEARDALTYRTERDALREALRETLFTAHALVCDAHRIARRWDGVTLPDHPYAPCGKCEK